MLTRVLLVSKLHQTQHLLLVISAIITVTLATGTAAAPSEHDTVGATVNGNTYYLSPNGDDTLSGTSESHPWATFNRAWRDLYPGDTLILLDGTYYQSIHPNVRDGLPGKPITVRAQNDGKAIVDGEFKRIPITLGESWPGPVGNYYVIEGIVARDSSEYVVGIYGHHNTIRRVSAYNANTDTNSAVIGIFFKGAQYNLIEDSVAAGSGRKMLYTFMGEHNTFRRNFVSWQEWDGRDWHDCWPWGDGIEIYNGSYNIIENSISYSRTPTWAFSLLSQGNPDTNGSIGNKILGSMAILAGMSPDGEPMSWESQRPQPTSYTCVRDFSWPGQRSGFHVYEHARLRDNLFQDIFAWGSAGLGIAWNHEEHTGNGNNRVVRATIVNNGHDNPCGGWPCQFGGVDTDALQRDLKHFDSVEDSNIPNVFVDWPDYPNGSRNMTSMNGQGAQLTHRYVDGLLTSEPLWPWPMEDRIQAELGYSVTDLMTSLISDNSLPPSKSTTTPAPVSPPTPTPVKTPLHVDSMKWRTSIPYIVNEKAASPPKATATPMPSPTPQPISTPDPPSETVSSVKQRVNIPDLGAEPPPPAFEPAIFWFGEAGPTDNYADVRLWHYDDYMKVAVHIIDRHLWFDSSPSEQDITEWDAVSLYLDLSNQSSETISDSSYRFVNQLWDGPTREASYKAGQSGWHVHDDLFTATDEWRGDYPNNNGWDSGWQAHFEIPFTSLGLSGPPPPGTTWRIAVAIHDRDDAVGSHIPDKVWPDGMDPNRPVTWGQLHFGLPSYTPPSTVASGTTTVRNGLNDATVMDAHVGGHGNCGGTMNAWTEWPLANYVGYDQFAIQNQWDIADFMCFSKYYVTFPLDKIPANSDIISATVTLTLFGNAGYEAGQAKPSAINALTIAEEWDEQTINWNNAPLATENIDVTWVNPIDFYGRVPYEWDVSRAVADAYALGQPLRLAFYSTDGDYHSGKYFWTSDFTGDESLRPTLNVAWSN